MDNLPEGTKGDILNELRMNPRTVDELCDMLDLSPTAVREHIYGLKARDLLQETNRRDGPGRPQKVYRLSSEAEDLFPKAYSDLSIMLLQLLEQLLGREEVQKKMVSMLLEWLEENGTLMEGLEKLGTYPETARGETEQERTIVFHQCPFLDMAKENDVLCDVDQEVLHEKTGAEIEIESTIARGGERCVFHLKGGDTAEIEALTGENGSADG